MRARVQNKIKDQPPTALAQADAARVHKRTPAEERPTARKRLRTYEAQSDIMDLMGSGGASESAAVRTAVALAAVAQGDEASRQAAQNPEAFTSDARGQSAGAVGQLIPG